MAADASAKIKLEGEKEYRDSLKKIISSQKEWDSELRAVQSSLDSETSAQEKARKKADLLSKSIDKQEEKIGLMRKQLEKVEKAYGKDSEQAKKLRTQINNATEALNKQKAQAKQLANKLKDLGSSMKKTGESMQKVGGAMTKAISGPLAAAAAVSIKAWYEVDDAMDSITTRTGATGKALEDMQGIAKSIATTIPTDFNTAAEAVGEVNTRFGATGQTLETLSTDFVKFSAITGQDVTSAVDGVQKAMAAFNLDADEAPGVLDAIARSSQKTGVKVDTLEASLVKNAASLSQMGLSANDAVGFLASLETSGTNAETVMSGLSKAMVNAAGSGMTLPELLADFQSYMKSSATETEKLQRACEIFGKKAGPAIYKACSDGSLDFATLAGAAEDASGTVNTTFQEIQDGADQFTIAKNRLVNVASEFGGAILDTMAPAVDGLSGALEDAGKWFANLDTERQEFIVKAAGFTAGVGPIVAGLGKIVEVAGNAVTKVGDLATKAEGFSTLGGPIGLAVAAIAGASILFNQAKKDMIEGDEALGELLDLTTAATEDLNSATKSLETALSDAQENIDDVEAKATTAQGLIEELEELDSQGEKTGTSIRRMKIICDELNTMYPGLNANVDENTGALSKGTAEMSKYVEQARKMQLVEAYSRATQSVMDQLVAAQAALTRAQRDAGPTQEAYEDLVTRQAAAQEAANAAIEAGKGSTDEAVTALANMDYELGVAKDAYAPYEQAVTEAQQAVDDAEETLGIYQEAQEALTKELGEGEAATDSAGAAMEELGDATAETAEETEVATEEIKVSYEDLYKAAYQAISGGIGLFDKLEQEEKATTASMIAGLASQQEAFSGYSTNLDTVLAWAAQSADENATAFVNALIDMGMDGADEMAALAQAISENSGEADAILAQFGDIEGNKSLIAGKIADFRGGVSEGFEGVSDDIEDESGEAAGAAEEFGEEVAEAAGSSKDDVADEAATLGDEFDQTRKQIGVQRALAKTEATGFGTTVSRSLKDKVASVKTSAQALGDATDGARVRINAQKARAQAAAMAFGGAIVNALNSKKEAITTAAGSMVAGGPAAITAKKESYQSAGAALGSAVASGIKEKKEAVTTAAGSLISGIKTKKADYTSAGESLGTAAGSGVATGFNNKKGTIGNAVAGGASTAKSYYDTYKKSGESLGDGIVTGLYNKKPAIDSAAASLASSAANTINKELKINSPSKVVIPSGEAIGEGLEVGMENRLGYVERAAATLSRAAVPEVSTGASIAASRATNMDALYSAVYSAVRAAAPQITISEKSFKRALVGMGVSVA